VYFLRCLLGSNFPLASFCFVDLLQTLIITTPQHSFIMGLSQVSGKILYSVTGLSRSDIAAIARARALQFSTNTQSPVKPEIDVDCSVIAYDFIQSRKSAAPAVADFLNEWALTGVIVNPCLDPPNKRPVCKQASIDRKSKHKKARIRSLTIRKEIRALSKKIEHERLDEEERVGLLKKLKKLESSCMAKEKHSTAVLSPTFPLSLKEALVGIGAND